ncbi:MAG: VOC family protein [Bacteroidota bacterium]|nr:VOC family protein [Bacteroidota bacterium]MDP4230258.1 VOC family protein [Bacteroidota bacterium]MDP4237516.1 VOC family protein [Bacteroidota bacterium]
MKIQFDHVAITTKDVMASIEFYHKSFAGVEVLYEDKTWGLLKVGGVKIALVSPGEHPPHVCYRVGSRSELEEYAAQRNGKIKVHRDKSESFYFKDTSDNAIEIVWYPDDYLK